ncbi:MAG: COX15/CtaA family protein [Bryobacteraceae bacterium]
MRSTRAFARYAWGVLAYNVMVVLWGGYVRATGSGAGCGGHWPACNGEVIPTAPSTQTIIEYSHRVTSGVALLLVAGLLIWALRLFPKGHKARRAAIFAAVFLAVEAALGAGLVLFHFTGQNISLVRALYLAVHLSNTLLLLGALTSTAWLATRRWTRGGAPAVLLISLPIVILVSATGAVAALGDTLFPSTSLQQGLRLDVTGTAHVLVQLRVLHPALAIVAGLFLIGAATSAIRWKASARAAGWTVAGLTVLQMVAGAVNVALLAPLWMQMLHLLLADVLWIALVVTALETLNAEDLALRSSIPAGSLPGLASRT